MTTCTTVTRCDYLVPGTGINVMGPDYSWDSRALSLDTCALNNGYFRFGFEPVQGAVFFAGVYDASLHSHVRPLRYKVAFEFNTNSFRAWLDGQSVTSFSSWTGTRLYIQGELGRFRFFDGGTVIYDTG